MNLLLDNDDITTIDELRAVAGSVLCVADLLDAIRCGVETGILILPNLDGDGGISKTLQNALIAAGFAKSDADMKAEITAIVESENVHPLNPKPKQQYKGFC